MTNQDKPESPAPVQHLVGFDPVKKWEQSRHLASWCGPDAVVSIPASELYFIIDRMHDMRRNMEIAKAERNYEHVAQHRKAMEMIRQAEDGRQYWMHAALGRETDGDARDAELLRMAQEIELLRESNSLLDRQPSNTQADGQ